MTNPELRKTMTAYHRQEAERSSASLVAALLEIAATKPIGYRTEIRVSSEKAHYAFDVQPLGSRSHSTKRVQVGWTKWITDDEFARYIIKALEHGAILSVDGTYAAYLNGGWEGLASDWAKVWLGSRAKDWPRNGIAKSGRPEPESAPLT